MEMRIVVPDAASASALAERWLEHASAGSAEMWLKTPPSTLGEEADEARPDYWLEHTEGFQVFGPNGRIGFVELVVRPEEGADGLVIRTGLFRTWTVFVPSHGVGAVVPRTGRLEVSKEQVKDAPNNGGSAEVEFSCPW
jgi:hypothetical protein